MDLALIPFHLIVTLIGLAGLCLLALLLKKGKRKSALAVVVVAIVVAYTKPVKLTTNTVSHNYQEDAKVLQKHRDHLSELPPRVTVDRPNYDDFLESEKNKLKD